MQVFRRLRFPRAYDLRCLGDLASPERIIYHVFVTILFILVHDFCDDLVYTGSPNSIDSDVSTTWVHKSRWPAMFRQLSFTQTQTLRCFCNHLEFIFWNLLESSYPCRNDVKTTFRTPSNITPDLRMTWVLTNSLILTSRLSLVHRMMTENEFQVVAKTS